MLSTALTYHTKSNLYAVKNPNFKNRIRTELCFWFLLLCVPTQWVYFLHDNYFDSFPLPECSGNIGVLSDHPLSKLKIHLQVEFIHHLLDLFQCEDCIRGVNG